MILFIYVARLASNDYSSYTTFTFLFKQVLKSGLLSGGYRDKTKQMILKYRNFSRLQTELREAEEEAYAVQEKLRELKDNITKNCNKKSQIEKSIIYAK